jgi:hypothetical protein
MKWKQYLSIWLVILLLAPSIWVHRIFMMGMPPPGSPVSSKPMFIPFGVIYFGKMMFGQLFRGDFGDPLMIFVFLILPILLYTFALSGVIYYLLRRLGILKKLNFIFS